MADKISVEIALEGGEQVEKQLDNIGSAGQKAFGDIQSAAEQVNLDSATTQFDDLGNAGQAAFQKVKVAAQSAASFEQIIQGVKKVEGSFEALGTAATRMASRLTRSLGVLGVAARALGPLGIALGVVGGAFIKFGDDSADALNGLTVAAAKLGQTPQQLDRVQKAFAQLGVAPDAVIKGLEQFQQAFGNLNSLQAFIGQLERMPDSVARTQLAIQTLGEALGGQVIAGLQTGAISAQNFATALGQVTPATQQQIVEAAKYQQALNQLNAAWTELKAAFTPIVTPILGFLTQELKNLKIDITGLIIDIKNLYTFLSALAAVTLGKTLSPEEIKAAAEAFKQLGTGAEQARQQATQATNTTTLALQETGAAAAQSGEQITQAGRQGAAAFDEASNAIRNTALTLAQLQSQAREAAWIAGLPRPDRIAPPGMASGGLLGGRGTGTSDSNLAWVSRGEHIMPARAVAQPGVLGFLEALRRSGGNLRGVLDGLGRFALGGLVPRPAFAAGGPVGSMSHVTINFPGTPPISGLRASSAVVEQLQKAAALAQVRSGGRKPSRYS